MQFVSRLTANLAYYLKLRGVKDFEEFQESLVLDKLCETLDRDTMSHIMIRQSNTWFKPKTLSEECDIYFASKNKSLDVQSYTYKSAGGLDFELPRK